MSLRKNSQMKCDIDEHILEKVAETIIDKYFLTEKKKKPEVIPELNEECTYTDDCCCFDCITSTIGKDIVRRESATKEITMKDNEESGKRVVGSDGDTVSDVTLEPEVQFTSSTKFEDDLKIESEDDSIKNRGDMPLITNFKKMEDKGWEKVMLEINTQYDDKGTQNENSVYTENSTQCECWEYKEQPIQCEIALNETKVEKIVSNHEITIQCGSGFSCKNTPIQCEVINVDTSIQCMNMGSFNASTQIGIGEEQELNVITYKQSMQMEKPKKVSFSWNCSYPCDCYKCQMKNILQGSYQTGKIKKFYDFSATAYCNTVLMSILKRIIYIIHKCDCCPEQNNGDGAVYKTKRKVKKVEENEKIYRKSETCFGGATDKIEPIRHCKTDQSLNKYKKPLKHRGMQGDGKPLSHPEDCLCIDCITMTL